MPEFALTYNYHADLFIHKLNAATYSNPRANWSDAEIREAAANAIADYGAAVQYAPTSEIRNKMDLNLAFLRGNWRGLTGRIEQVLSTGGCSPDNWLAAEMDQHEFSANGMVSAAFWCACGSPWDLEATPNFAAKLEEGNLPWPPKSPIGFPLKDW